MPSRRIPFNFPASQKVKGDPSTRIVPMLAQDDMSLKLVR